MPFHRASLSSLLLGALAGVALSGAPLLAQEAPQSQPAVVPSQAIGELPAGWTRRGDTGVTALPGGKFAFGVQYRVVYDASNLPGPGGTTPDETASYTTKVQQQISPVATPWVCVHREEIGFSHRRSASMNPDGEVLSVILKAATALTEHVRGVDQRRSEAERLDRSAV